MLLSKPQQNQRNLDFQDYTSTICLPCLGPQPPAWGPCSLTADLAGDVPPWSCSAASEIRSRPGDTSWRNTVCISSVVFKLAHDADLQSGCPSFLPLAHIIQQPWRGTQGKRGSSFIFTCTVPTDIIQALLYASKYKQPPEQCKYPIGA